MNFSMRIGINSVIGMLLAASLVACGGGGDSASPGIPTAPSTPVAITTANAPTVAAAALDGSATLLTIGDSVSTRPALAVSPVASGALGRVNLKAAKQAQQFLSKSQFGTTIVETTETRPTFVETTNCPGGGTFTVSGPDFGTSFRMTFNNCTEGDEVTNGTIDVTNFISTPTEFSANSRVDLTVAIIGYPPVRFVSTYSFETTNDLAGNNTTLLTGASFSIIYGSNVTTLSNFSFTEIYTAATNIYSNTSSYTLASTEFGGSVTVTTVAPIQQYVYRFYPFAGQFVVTGLNNTKVRVTILGDETTINNNVQIEIDADGDNAYETTLLRAWDAL